MGATGATIITFASEAIGLYHPLDGIANLKKKALLTGIDAAI